MVTPPVASFPDTPSRLVESRDGTRIAVFTAGTGPPLLLVQAARRVRRRGNHPPHGLDARAMALRAFQAAHPSPATAAIHDDGDVKVGRNVSVQRTLVHKAPERKKIPLSNCLLLARGPDQSFHVVEIVLERLAARGREAVDGARQPPVK